MPANCGIVFFSFKEFSLKCVRMLAFGPKWCLQATPKVEQVGLCALMDAKPVCQAPYRMGFLKLKAKDIHTKGLTLADASTNATLLDAFLISSRIPFWSLVENLQWML